MDDQTRTRAMTGGEFRMARTWLGLSGAEMAAALTSERHDGPVRADTVRRWEAGRETVTQAAIQQIEELDAFTADVAARLVAALRAVEPSERVVEVYRPSEVARGEAPELVGQHGAGWWCQVVARARQVVPDVQVGYRSELTVPGVQVAAA